MEACTLHPTARIQWYSMARVRMCMQHMQARVIWRAGRGALGLTLAELALVSMGGGVVRERLRGDIAEGIHRRHECLEVRWGGREVAWS